MLRIISGFRIWIGGGQYSSVSPSAGPRATMMAATVPVPPGRFSTITGWPRIAPIGSAMMRASVSAVPPGASGTMMRSGRAGCQACARAGPAASAAARSVRRCMARYSSRMPVARTTSPQVS